MLYIQDNLRYTFDYCIFGYPNASNIASTPCSTSTACGGLEAALTYDSLDKDNVQSYGYCTADGSAMSGQFVSKCQACVAASDDQGYMTNFMVALEAGCQQQPATGTAIGLNDTIFSSTMISAENPKSLAAASSSKSGLPTTTLVGIIVGILVVLVIGAAVVFVQRRKRVNRRLRLEVSSRNGGPKRGRRRPVSSLSFRCQTHVSPRSPAFGSNVTDTIGTVMRGTEKKPYNDIKSPEGPYESPLTQNPTWSTSSSSLKRGFGAERHPTLPLYNITTTPMGDTKAPIPTVPSNVYHYASPSPKSNSFSPIDDATTTPASTTSTRSTAALLPLKPYNPADYGFGVPAIPQMGNNPGNEHVNPNATYSSPTSASTASPLLSRSNWDSLPQQKKSHGRKSPMWDSPSPMLPPRTSSRSQRSGLNVLAGATAKQSGKGGNSNSGSPVESNEIKIMFPGPPSPRKY
jgi:hypothetical protein